MTPVAIHEAAHAVVALVRGVPVKFLQVFASGRGFAHPIHTKDMEPVDLILVLLSAGIATRKHTGGADGMDGDDVARARELIALLHDVPPDSEEAAARLAAYATVAAVAVARHWASILRVARALDRRGTLSGADVADLL